MATITESTYSRGFSLGRQSNRVLILDINGTEDEAVVQALIEGYISAAYGGLALESTSVEHKGGKVWQATVRYAGLDGTDEYTFDTGGGTQKMTQSYGTVRYAPAGLTAPNFGGAIGVSEDRVEGVDVIVPAYQFS